MAYMPNKATGKMRKLARPDFGPYRVLETHANEVTIRSGTNQRKLPSELT